MKNKLSKLDCNIFVLTAPIFPLQTLWGATLCLLYSIYFLIHNGNMKSETVTTALSTPIYV